MADVLAFFISSFILYFLQTQSTSYVSALQKDPFELYVFIGLTLFWLAGNIDEIIDRMKFDILYIENMSLRMDFKIIFYTIYVMLMGRGR